MPPYSRLSTARMLAALFGFVLVAGGCEDSTFQDLLSGVLSGVGLEDVNVVNGTGREVAGALRVTGPAGDRVLEEQFRLPPGESGVQVNLSAEEDSALVTYGGAFSEAGRYGVSLELEEPVGGAASLEESVEITAPGEQHLIVVLDPSEEPPIQAIRAPNPEENG